jgi:Spy/CpxP family protein refolding chaperone
MLKALTPLFGAVLFAATTSLYAQATPAPAPKADKGGRHFDCSQAKDPKACEEHREKMKAAYAKAKSACDGKEGAEHRACMRDEMCAQSKDPAKCKAEVNKRAEAFKKARAACGDKKGDELRACMREQRGKK